VPGIVPHSYWLRSQIPPASELPSVTSANRRRVHGF
jgi:hypothetical protein